MPLPALNVLKHNVLRAFRIKREEGGRKKERQRKKQI
jgi:hypothetical protein